MQEQGETGTSMEPEASHPSHTERERRDRERGWVTPKNLAMS